MKFPNTDPMCKYSTVDKKNYKFAVALKKHSLQLNILHVCNSYAYHIGSSLRSRTASWGSVSRASSPPHLVSTIASRMQMSLKLIPVIIRAPKIELLNVFLCVATIITMPVIDDVLSG